MFHTEFAKKTVRAHYLTSTRLLPNRKSAILFPPRQLYESRPLTELHLRKGKLNLRIKVEAVTAGPDAKLSDICALFYVEIAIILATVFTGKQDNPRSVNRQHNDCRQVQQPFPVENLQEVILYTCTARAEFHLYRPLSCQQSKPDPCYKESVPGHKTFPGTDP